LDRDGGYSEKVNGVTFEHKGMDLNYFGARYYDPVIGYWISLDPKEQFWSGYSYSSNGFNPVNAIDPDGNNQYLLVNEDGIHAAILIENPERRGTWFRADFMPQDPYIPIVLETGKLDINPIASTLRDLVSPGEQINLIKTTSKQDAKSLAYARKIQKDGGLYSLFFRNCRTVRNDIANAGRPFYSKLPSQTVTPSFAIKFEQFWTGLWLGGRGSGSENKKEK